MANRSRKTKNTYPIPFWSHYPTTENPANLLTRDINAQELQDSPLREHGPWWFLSESQWPIWNSSQVFQLQLPMTLEEALSFAETATKHPNSGLNHINDTSRYNTSSTLLGLTAYDLRFIRFLHKLEPKNVEPLCASERDDALQKRIKTCQALHYHDEIVNFTSGTSARLPLIRQLSVFLDSNGLHRCGGRIPNASLDHSAKFLV